MTASEKTLLWRKAAVLGSFWAASEIVLGSFLHNARIPLRGHLLTGIGIAVLTAGHRLWPERGLLWRAGLICAAMKSVSPSAVIFGPMLAISAEGLLLELGVLAGGANLAGYVLGGGLAMSWALFHKIGNIFLFYGPDTLALYAGGVARLRTWLGAPSGSLWTPVAAVWTAHFLGGAAAAVVGWRVGRGECLSPSAPPSALRGAPPRPAPSGRAPSRTALLLHAAFVAAFMGFGQLIPLWACAVVGALYAGICVAAYPRARALSSRVGLWAGVLGVAVLAGALLGRWDSGLRMGLRAVLLTLGFSCIGEELRDPRLVGWMRRRGAGAFFDALEQAFEALPQVISGLPSARRLLRAPVFSLRDAVARAPALLDGMGRGRIILLTGKHGEGKSEALARLADGLRRSGRSVGGLHCPGLWAERERDGFDVVDLRTGERRLLCRRIGPADWPALGPFRFDPEGVRFGLETLREARRADVDVLFVDEVGYLELQGRGWAAELDALVRERRSPMVWVVRDYLVDEVRQRWGLGDSPVTAAGSLSEDAVQGVLGAHAVSPSGA